MTNSKKIVWGIIVVVLFFLLLFVWRFFQLANSEFVKVPTTNETAYELQELKTQADFKMLGKEMLTGGGFEPGWNFKLNLVGTKFGLDMVSQYGDTKYVGYIDLTSQSTSTKVWSGNVLDKNNQTQQIQINLQTKKCTEPSGDEVDYTIKVKVSDEDVEGCAKMTILHFIMFEQIINFLWLIYYDYGYFVGCLVMALVWYFIFYFRKDLRKEMLTTSVFFAPLGFTELFYAEYWQPITLFNLIEKFGVSIEDILFCFFLGGISATVWEFVFRKKETRIDHKKHKHHILAISSALLFLGLLIEFYVPFYTIFTMSFFLIFVIIFWTLFTRKDMLLYILESSFVFMVVYMFFMYFVTVPVDYFIRFYKPEYMTGWYFLNMPFEEYLFAFSAGTLGSFLYKYIYDLKVSK